MGTENPVHLSPLPARVPTHPPVISELEALRNQILNRMLNGTSIIATVAFLIAVNFESQLGQLNIIIAASIAYTWLLAITLFRSLPYWFRTGSLLVIIFGMGLTSLIVNGLNGTGRIFLFTLPVIASILSGSRLGLGAMAVSMGSILLAGWSITTGKITLTEAEIITTATDPGFWITGAFTFLMMGVVTTLTQSGLVRGLERSLEKTQALTRQLASRQADLEREVQKRTDDLERRIVQIQTAADVSRAISGLTRSQDLLNQVVELVAERFGLYYAGVFLLDEYGEYAVLNAGSGEAGKKMLARHHRLLVGGDSMIGWAAANRQPRIALDVGQEAVRFNNPYLPATRSEMALPILAGERVLGALTIQSQHPAAFDTADIKVLEGIADSLGTALENARLINETQRNLVEIQTLHSQYLAKAWSKIPEQASDLEYTFEAGDVEQIDGSQPIEVPLTLRDQVIGSLVLETGPEGFTPAENALLDSVATQAALALENVRLLQESQSHAQREEQINQISNQVRASTNMQTVLQNTVRELGKVLGASRTFIQLGIFDNEDNPEQIQATGDQKGNSEPLNSNAKGKIHE